MAASSDVPLSPLASVGKSLPSGLLSYVKGAAETTERHESPTKEAAEITEEGSIMNYPNYPIYRVF